MSDPISAITRTVVATAVVFIYAILAHNFSTIENVGITLLPLALSPLFLALGLRFRKKILPIVILLVAGVIILPSWFDVLANNLAWVYFAQDTVLNASLCFLFGHSLRAGQTPLCSRIAGALQPNPSAHLLAYTRRVTIAWTGFFAVIVGISTLLFFIADRTTWSNFANLLYWLFLLAMFALEYLVRLCVLPRAERAGFWATIIGFRHAAMAAKKTEARA